MIVLCDESLYEDGRGEAREREREGEKWIDCDR